MDKFGDIDLFVKVVKYRSFAGAARAAHLSPASVTIKINRLEQHYGVRLLNRTTRRVALTEEGKGFYERCLHILSEVEEAEERLLSGKESFSGSLNVSASIDFGQQYIAPLLAKFSDIHPSLSIQLNLTDGVVNLIEDGFDIGIRSGVLQDNRMVARKLADNKRMLCASPSYINKYGLPKRPEDLNHHRCLTMIRNGEQLTEWYFKTANTNKSVLIQPAMTSNNGAQLRQWAILDKGIILKSYWDIKEDILSGKLKPILEEYVLDFESKGLFGGADLNIVYPGREFLPARVSAFINMLLEEFRGK